MVIGRITRERERFFEGTGELRLSDGDVAATATGKYLKMPLDRIGEFDRESNEWRVVPSNRDPSDFDL